LRRIVRNPLRRTAQILMPVQSAIVIFAKRHAPAGSADYSDLRFEFLVPFEELRQGRDHHVRRTVQTGIFSPLLSINQQTLVRNLGGGLAATVANVEAGNGAYAISGAAKGIKGLLEAETERADDPGRYDSDVRPGIYSV